MYKCVRYFRLQSICNASIIEFDINRYIDGHGTRGGEGQKKQCSFLSHIGWITATALLVDMLLQGNSRSMVSLSKDVLSATRISPDVGSNHRLLSITLSPINRVYLILPFSPSSLSVALTCKKIWWRSIFPVGVFSVQINLLQFTLKYHYLKTKFRT